MEDCCGLAVRDFPLLWSRRSWRFPSGMRFLLGRSPKLLPARAPVQPRPHLRHRACALALALALGLAWPSAPTDATTSRVPLPLILMLLVHSRIVLTRGPILSRKCLLPPCLLTVLVLVFASDHLQQAIFIPRASEDQRVCVCHFILGFRLNPNSHIPSLATTCALESMAWIWVGLGLVGRSVTHIIGS
ncbi:hypothetical protein BDW75DRAFT_199358, partial [Aspergillus navahoensis]